MADEAVTGIGAGVAAGAAVGAAKKVWGQTFFDQVTAGLTGAGGGGGFKFPSVEALDATIRGWEAERDKIIADRRLIQDLLSLVQPPAKDQSSTGYVTVAQDRLLTLEEQNSSMLEYAKNYIEKLESAKRGQHGQDAEAEGAFSKFGETS